MYSKEQQLKKNSKPSDGLKFGQRRSGGGFGTKASVWNKSGKKTKRLTKASQSDKSKLREQAVGAFNKFIRFRDSELGCISCGTFDAVFHAGHYKCAGGNPQLRFEEMNVHKQCEYCNVTLYSNEKNYKIGLIKKIGLENVEKLECDKSVKKYSAEDYRNIINKYSGMC